MLNNVSVMGRLCETPELKKTQTDVSVTTFTLACQRSYAPKGKERETDFVNIVAWKGTAEFITKYFAKGQLMIVTGSIQTRSYKDKEGKNLKVVEILATNAYFCGDKKQHEESHEEPRNDDFQPVAGDDDLPF